MTKKRMKEEPIRDPNEILEEEQLPADDEVVEKPIEETEEQRLATELEEAQAKAAEYLDGWQRTQAEFANYRKRQEASRQQQIQMSNANLISKILPITDDLERALQTLPPGIGGLTWVDGVLLIKRKLDTVLDSEGVTSIDTQGQTFDPLYHEAVTYEEVEGYREGQIIGEMQRGYKLGDHVLRPAMVRVARAPIEPPPAEPDSDEATSEEE